MCHSKLCIGQLSPGLMIRYSNKPLDPIWMRSPGLYETEGNCDSGLRRSWLATAWASESTQNLDTAACAGSRRNTVPPGALVQEHWVVLVLGQGRGSLVSGASSRCAPQQPEGVLSGTVLCNNVAFQGLFIWKSAGDRQEWIQRSAMI